MNPYKLPLSGMEIYFRQFVGRDDLLLAEASMLDMALAIALLESVAVNFEGGVIDWAGLPALDIDTALLHLRRSVFGDRVSTDIVCPDQACGKQIDVDFGLGEFLAHHTPRKVRGIEAPDADNPGWFQLAGGTAMFRLPTGRDIVAAAAEIEPERELVRRCIRPEGLHPGVVRRIIRALEAMAPSLADELQGECAECGATVEIYFDARNFTLRELRDQASFIYGDTHMLAQHYHWPEADILAIPRERRIQYVEILKQHQGVY